MKITDLELSVIQNIGMNELPRLMAEFLIVIRMRNVGSILLPATGRLKSNWIRYRGWWEAFQKKG